MSPSGFAVGDLVGAGVGAAAAAEVGDSSCAEVGDTVGNTDVAEVGHDMSWAKKT